MISVVELKRHMVSTSFFGIIVVKFCYRKKLYLVIIFEINKD